MYNMTIFEQFNFLSHYDVILEMRFQQGAGGHFILGNRVIYNP